MRTLDIFARGIIGAVMASVFLLAIEHWHDQELRAKGCIATGRPGIETELTKGVSVVGRVWFCQERAP